MKILLLLGVGVLIVEALLSWGYSAVKAFGRGDATIVALLLAGFFVSLSLFVAVKAVCHECLTAPMAVVCEHSYKGGAVDVQIESNRSYAGGYIKERHFAGCVFYWHENNTGGN